MKIFRVIWEWFSGGTIYQHLWVTLQETALAFVIGSVLGLARRPVAGTLAHRLGALRSLHHGDERDAARGARADLHGVVRPRHLVEGGARRDARLLHRVLQRLPGREGSEPRGAQQHGDAGRQPPAAAALRVPAVGDLVGLLEPAHLGRHGVRGRGGGRVPRLGAAAWATSSSRPRARSTSTRCSRASSCSPRSRWCSTSRSAGSSARLLVWRPAQSETEQL